MNYPKSVFSVLLFPVLFLSAASGFGQPAWTDFTYIDWNSGVDPAIAGNTNNRHYDNRQGWDGERFLPIQERNEGAPAKWSYWIVYSSDGKTWGTPISISIPRDWDVGHHALAIEPDTFPSNDVAWVEQSKNIKFKLWYAAHGDNYHYRYSESTDGLSWNSFLEYAYCPPQDKLDFNPSSACGTTRLMIKPDVLYLPDKSSALDTSVPMNNRYVCYLGSNVDYNCSGNPGYFEMYISSNGLDWKLYAWDDQCESRWSAYTSAPSEVTEFITFTGWSAGQAQPSQIYTSSIEEVYRNGEVQGYMLWLDRYTAGIYSYYSTNGYDWTLREEPINTIGTTTTGVAWNTERNYGFDSVRLGESYFILRNGKYNTGAAIARGPISAEVDTPPDPSSGDIDIDYRLFHWNNQSTPIVYFTFSTDGSNWNTATGTWSDSYRAGIGGYPHTFTWYSLNDLPSGADDVYFRVQPWSTPAPGSYDTTDPFSVAVTSPTPPPGATPTAPPTATPSPPPTATPSPPPTATPTATTSAPPSPTPSCGPTVARENMVIVSGDYDGDGTSDIAVFRKSNGLWAIRGLTRLYFGAAADLPVSGDYHGDGTTEMSIFRPATGLWALRGVSRIYYGSGALPVPADYNGDGIADVAVFRTASGLWSVRGVTRVHYGAPGDQPVPGDYGTAGTSSIGIFRPATGLWALRGISRIYYGRDGDWWIPGDYDGDGIWEPAVFRPRTGLWAARGVSRFYYGRCVDYPLRADFNGDGISDTAVFRQLSGLWAVRTVTRAYYGTGGDIPVTR